MIDFSPTIVDGHLKTGETIIGNGGMFISGCCNSIAYENTILVDPNLASAVAKNAYGGPNS